MYMFTFDCLTLNNLAVLYSCHGCFYLLYKLCCIVACTYTGVYLSLNETVRPNNSYIMISEIGNSIDNRLQCITDRMPCCGSEAVEEWYFPGDGGMVPTVTGATTFYRSR